MSTVHPTIHVWYPTEGMELMSEESRVTCVSSAMTCIPLRISFVGSSINPMKLSSTMKVDGQM
jgi:hypothetical protein